MIHPRGAVRLYSRMLALYPKAYRHEYGSDMVQLFADRYRDERPRGDVFRFVRFWGGMVGDLLKTALTERTGSVVSSFKQNWWKWAIGVFAAFQMVFAVEWVIGIFADSDRGVSALIAEAVVPIVGVTTLVVGLRLLNSKPKAAAILLTIGLLPVALAGALFFWFPPMWLVSVLGVYLIVKVFMETGRITRGSAAPA
jgi:hypothetical protein